MAVPGHDQRDHEFARKYQLPIKQVVAPAEDEQCDIEHEAFVAKGILVNSGKYDGLDFASAFDAIAGALEAIGRGSVTTNYRLRDWGVSRQRYWGSPPTSVRSLRRACYVGVSPMPSSPAHPTTTHCIARCTTVESQTTSSLI